MIIIIIIIIIIIRVIGGRGLMVDYPRDKFGDCSFSHYRRH